MERRCLLIWTWTLSATDLHPLTFRPPKSEKTQLKFAIVWQLILQQYRELIGYTVNPLDSKGNYSATSNNTKLVHWPSMGRLLHCTASKSCDDKTQTDTRKLRLLSGRYPLSLKADVLPMRLWPERQPSLFYGSSFLRISCSSFYRCFPAAAATHNDVGVIRRTICEHS